MLSLLAKLDELYNNSASNRLLQISKIHFIEYKNRMFTKNPCINLRACDAASSYHCLSIITGSKVQKWECNLNCCSDFPGTNATDLE